MGDNIFRLKTDRLLEKAIFQFRSRGLGKGPGFQPLAGFTSLGEEVFYTKREGLHLIVLVRLRQEGVFSVNIFSGGNEMGQTGLDVEADVAVTEIDGNYGPNGNNVTRAAAGLGACRS